MAVGAICLWRGKRLCMWKKYCTFACGILAYLIRYEEDIRYNRAALHNGNIHHGAACGTDYWTDYRTM